TYLIDTDGRVAFYDLWTYAPTLHEAIQSLLAQRGRGVVDGGANRLPLLLPAMTVGWRGLRRGLPQSYVDLELASPGAGALTWIGYQLRPLLKPFGQRAKPLPAAAKVGLAAGAGALAILAVRRLRRRR